MPRKTETTTRLTAGVLCALVLVACDRGEAPRTSGQAIARVNGTELTVHQLNAELAQRLGAAPGSEDAQVLRKQAADALVDRTLLVQQAKQQGLDEDPAIVQAVARAREEVLAAAYLERTLDVHSPPTESEMREYYDSHPELYARRVVFKVEQVKTGPEVELEAIEEAAERMEGAAEVVAWLAGQGADPEVRMTTLPSDQVPPELRERLQSLEPGQAVLLRQGDQVFLNYLVEATPMPVSFDRARPAIERGLSEQRRRERVREEIDRLRASAQIAYLGDLAEGEKAAPAASPDVQAGPGGSREGAGIAASEGDKAADADDDGVAAGLRGLQ